MRDTEMKKTQNNNQTRRPARAQKGDNKPPEQNAGKKSISRENESKAPKTRPVSDTAVGTEPPEVYENAVIHYLDDDAYRFEDAHQDPVASVEVNDGSLDRNPALLEKADLVESSEGPDCEIVKEEKEETFHEVCNDTKSSGSDDEFVNADLDRAAFNEKVEEMEKRIESLEEELREVAALEISLYSVTAEHGSSAHKVHTPARRLSRIYMHASKHWAQNKRATIARNTVSGLILVARTCGNDVSRLTYWLSNTVVLREIISQAFGNSCQFSPLTMAEPNGAEQRTKMSLDKFIEDWQETRRTFTAALEKIESWIFSRIVESVWWQTLTPNMQSPVEDLITSKLLCPALGDQQQGRFCIDLWKSAFQDAFHRLCPVRAGGHECGCLPVLARMVMEQCINRLDVAMFNAILRESAHQIPTDPVSDPIVDTRVLPIPAGDLSFGSGARLKNCVGNWFRWLVDSLGIESDYASVSEDDNNQSGGTEGKCFQLLDELSDLLMLPKDLLMDRSIRKEVCPCISLSLMKRVLCNFSPDEFCPDDVPGEVLEALNAESGVDGGLSGGGGGASAAGGFPYIAKAVEYSPPSSLDVAEKVAEAGVHPQLLGRIASMVQRKGYTSDDELDDLDSPLTPVINRLQNGNQASKPAKQQLGEEVNSRFQLLREAWSG